MSQEENNNSRINEVIAKAFQEALNREHEYVTLEHILRVMLDEEEIKDALSEFQVDVEALKEEIDQWLRDQEDIRVEGITKPRKTATLERCFNQPNTSKPVSIISLSGITTERNLLFFVTRPALDFGFASNCQCTLMASSCRST